MRKKESGSNAFAVSMTGFILGAVVSAAYMISKDKKKQEQLKETFKEVRKTALDRVDNLRQELDEKSEEAEDEMKELRKGGTNRVTVH